MSLFRCSLVASALALGLTGCAHLGTGVPEGGSAPNGKKDAKNDKGPQTLLEWKLCKKEEKGKDDEKKKDEKDRKKGDEKNNGAAEKKEDEAKEPEEEKRIDPDRPHFPEAASTVGNGRAVLESGLTYYGSRSTEFQHQLSAPEALLRVGLFADWLEFRVSQNWASQNVPITVAPTPGKASTIFVKQSGFEDINVGVKLALTEQEQWLPESALILALTAPTGASPFTNNAVMPAVNYDFTWDVIKDRFSIEGVVEFAGATDELGHHYTSFASGLTAVIDLTPNLQSFTELDSIYALGAIDPGLGGPQHYLVTGFVYFIGKNMEIDIRAGVGLTDHSSNYLSGLGFSVRY
jgi:hypothetical protein